MDTPAKVDLDPTREYRFEASSTVTDADLPALGALAVMSNFRRLDLSGCTKVTELPFGKASPALIHVEHLNCYGCTGLTDAGVFSLALLLGLVRLDLVRCTQVTDGMLAHLVWMTKLQHLDLSGCEWVTDAGLVHLAKIGTLRHVGLRNTQVTDAGVERLRRAIPNLTADR